MCSVRFLRVASFPAIGPQLPTAGFFVSKTKRPKTGSLGPVLETVASVEKEQNKRYIKFVRKVFEGCGGLFSKSPPQIFVTQTNSNNRASLSGGPNSLISEISRTD